MKQPIPQLQHECKHLYNNEQLFDSLNRLSEIDKSQLFGILQAALNDRLTHANKLVIEQAVIKLLNL